MGDIYRKNRETIDVHETLENGIIVPHHTVDVLGDHGKVGRDFAGFFDDFLREERWCQV